MIKATLKMNNGRVVVDGLFLNILPFTDTEIQLPTGERYVVKSLKLRLDRSANHVDIEVEKLN